MIHHTICSRCEEDVKRDDMRLYHNEPMCLWCKDELQKLDERFLELQEDQLRDAEFV